jgi:hypothetical protein
MRRILILAVIITLAASAVRAQEVPPPVSEKGPNFPTSQRGPAYPAVAPNQQSGPSFGAQAPAPEQRNTPQQELPEGRSYPAEREMQSQPER